MNGIMQSNLSVIRKNFPKADKKTKNLMRALGMRTWLYMFASAPWHGFE